MSAQTTYKFNSSIAFAGGLVDLAPYEIDTFANEEANGVMKFGMGVVSGTKANQIKKPTSGKKATDFVGVTVNNLTTEYDTYGSDLAIRNKASMGVMRYGRVYARIKSGLTINVGDAVYLIVSGDNAGCFSNSSSDGEAIKARFVSVKDASLNIAAIELFNQAQEVPAEE